MAYINTETNVYPVTEQEIKQQYANTSFSVPFIPPQEYQLVFEQPVPEFNPDTQFVIKDKPFVTTKGHYEVGWIVQDLPQDVVDVNVKTKQINSIKSQITELENQVTQRRLREAVLGIDNGWLANLNTSIDNLRQQLQGLV